MLDGFLVVDKPPGLTSHDVVAVVRAVTGAPKVGHTGTLDPFATGVLPLALGKATRLIQYLDESLKEYDAWVRLGEATDTGDPTGTMIEQKPIPTLERKQVEKVVAGFVGKRMQMPPRYSAIKVQGRPLYDYARAGKEVTVNARPIEVYGMELLELEEGRLRVLIQCSRGTYARVLAEELGVALGTVAHLEALRRTRSGDFLLPGAMTLSQLAEAAAGDPVWTKVLRPARGEQRIPWFPREQVEDSLRRWIQSPHRLLQHLPALQLSEGEVRRLRQGITPGRAAGHNVPVVLLSGEEVLTVVAPAPAKGLTPDLVSDNSAATRESR